jgi:hypothetical protein
MTERETWEAVAGLLAEYGADAVKVAAERLDALYLECDPEACARWAQIYRMLKVLSEEKPAGMRLN